MSEVYSTLTALFTDIADAIRETTGDTDSIIADDFPGCNQGEVTGCSSYA